MKKLLITLVFTITLVYMGYSQIKFMGIPMNLSKSEMISKLEEKGFVRTQEVVEFENLENRILNQGGTLDGGKLRENDRPYMMQGYFDGKRCKLYIEPYKGKLSQIIVIIEDPYRELNAKIQYNLYVEQLSKKYTKFFDFDYTIDLDKDISEPFDQNISAHFLTAYDDIEKPHGMIHLEMSHPKYDEFYLAIRYYNMDNMPDGEDL